MSEVFLQELKDVYHAEMQLVEALPKPNAKPWQVSSTVYAIQIIQVMSDARTLAGRREATGRWRNFSRRDLEKHSVVIHFVRDARAPETENWESARPGEPVSELARPYF